MAKETGRNLGCVTSITQHSSRPPFFTLSVHEKNARNQYSDLKFLWADFKESETPTPPAVNSPSTAIAAAQSPALPQQQLPPDVPSTPPPLIPANFGKKKTLFRSFSHYKKSLC